MRVAITGATGFIGSHLVDRLLADGHHITALVRQASVAAALEARGVKAVRGNVLGARDVEQTVDGNQVVYHLARAKGHGVSPGSEVHATNVEGTATVARLAARARVERLVHASSTAVYGTRVSRQPVSEDLSPNPDSPYARSKMLGERAALAHAGDQLPVVIARITAVFGPRCTSWIRLFRSIGAGQLRLIGRGDNWHHPADVADIVDGLVRCATVGGLQGGFYNLAGPEPVRVRDLVRQIAEELNGVTDLPRALPRIPFEVYLGMSRLADRVLGVRLPRVDGVAFLTSDRILDISRATRDLGYAPTVNVADGITRTADWYRQKAML